MSVYKVGNKWRAQKYVNGKYVHLGYFKLKREAVAAIEGHTVQSIYRIGVATEDNLVTKKQKSAQQANMKRVEKNWNDSLVELGGQESFFGRVKRWLSGK